MDYLIQTASQLANHLSSLRRAQNMTQAQLGQLVGLDQTRIAKIEKDPQRISVQQLVQILGALGVRILLQSAQPSPHKPATRNAADW